MTNEERWVKSWIGQLETDLNSSMPTSQHVRVADQKRLVYEYKVKDYEGDRPHDSTYNTYKTDVLIYSEVEGDSWIPRVVIETKLKGVTTHDALTYSAKAATHKHVHPYLRYGILVGDFGSNPLTAKLLKHGAHFDFMIKWETTSPEQSEWHELIDLLKSETEASRTIERLHEQSRKKDRSKIHLIHRPLLIK